MAVKLGLIDQQDHPSCHKSAGSYKLTGHANCLQDPSQFAYSQQMKRADLRLLGNTPALFVTAKEPVDIMLCLAGGPDAEPSTHPNRYLSFWPISNVTPDGPFSIMLSLPGSPPAQIPTHPTMYSKPGSTCQVIVQEPV